MAAFRAYVRVIEACNWDPMDALVLVSVAEQLVAHPIVDLTHQQPRHFPGATDVSPQQLREAFWLYDEEEEMEIHHIVRAQRSVHEGRRFDSLGDFVAQLSALEAGEEAAEEEEDEDEKVGSKRARRAGCSE